MARTSTSTPISLLSNIWMSSAAERVEWPMVKNIANTTCLID
jgi:hypothetical protein